jgi:hypothetical protein
MLVGPAGFAAVNGCMSAVRHSEPSSYLQTAAQTASPRRTTRTPNEDLEESMLAGPASFAAVNDAHPNCAAWIL